MGQVHNYWMGYWTYLYIYIERERSTMIISSAIAKYKYLSSFPYSVKSVISSPRIPDWHTWTNPGQLKHPVFSNPSAVHPNSMLAKGASTPVPTRAEAALICSESSSSNYEQSDSALLLNTDQLLPLEY